VEKNAHIISNTYSALVYICLILIGLYILYKFYNFSKGKVSCVKAIIDTNGSGKVVNIKIHSRVWRWHKRMCHYVN